MTNFNSEKKIYNNIEIPSELDDIVKLAIKKSEKNKPHFKSRFTPSKYLKAAAIVAVSTTILGLNTVDSFAEGASKIPIIGNLAKILTISSYHTKDDDKSIDVNIPSIKSEDTKDDKFLVNVNSEIEKICDSYRKEAEMRVEEYKQAFIETGGTEEEFKKKNIKINVDYKIKSQTKDYVSFVINANESWVSGYAETHYYNLNLKDNTYIKLKDVLGNDYINIVNKDISRQIKERQETNKNEMFFETNDGGFKSIDDNTQFYINEKENPVIVFPKYQIAPGYMGSPEFEITK